MEMLESPNLKVFNAPSRSFKSSSQSYVLSIASLQSHFAISLSTPANAIEILDKTTLLSVQTLPGHDIAISSLRSVDNIGGSNHESLLSSGKDGCLKVWDSRSNSEASKMTYLGTSRPLLCCDISSDGMTIAAGTDLQGEDAFILYWDPRQPTNPLRIHGSTHSDDITTLSFLKSPASECPSHREILSASSDGLLTVSNSDEDNEDEAVLNVGNWGCSISQAGWFPTPSGVKIWAASDMETFSTWSVELEQYRSLDIREPSLHTQRRTWVTDYLIACEPIGQELGVFVASNEGDVALISNPELLSLQSPWHLQSLWRNNHVGIVRSLLWDRQNNVLVTGGEDQKICVWSGPDFQESDDRMDVDSVARKRPLDDGSANVRTFISDAKSKAKAVRQGGETA